MKVVSVLNRKGGVGKSTIACQIARGMQLREKEVLIVDTDAQGTASDWAESGGEDTPLVVKIDRATLEDDIPKAGKQYDVVIIDGAAKAERMNVSAVKASDLVLIPLQPSAVDIWPVKETVELIKTRQEVAGRPQGAFVVSRAVTGTNLASSIEDVLSGLELPLMTARTHQRVAYPEAMGRGVGVMDLNGREKAAREVESMTSEVLELLNQQRPVVT
ncbi:ParA family partition ATPase [Salinibacter altiplanensis]|uniref:ParA family partition ATPase n=1 Tax=Salinibacter altiplanensis TaxID=1803181 RepID=UPI000C9EEB04|nr:ParA family partition ATPase [Salinibacter altiplanensis]